MQRLQRVRGWPHIRLHGPALVTVRLGGGSQTALPPLRYRTVSRCCASTGHRLLSQEAACTSTSVRSEEEEEAPGALWNMDSVVAAEAARGRKPSDVRIVLGMSGGVDSSVSALLLARRGFNLQGAYMLNWDPQEEDEHGRCRADEDYADAKKVCSQLGIPLHKVEFIREYWTDVFMPSMTAYEAGYTPNPDILCNREIKFKRFLQLCTSRFQADYIATGHYAQLWRLQTGKIYLMRGVDKAKDQSYFLSNITQDALARSVFPVGHMTKTEVKELARQEGMDWLNDKKSSSGICFVGKRRFSQFVDKYTTSTTGLFRSLDGTTLGNHEGLTKYTIGQRARIPGRLESSKLYVVDKCIEQNTVVLAEGPDHPALLTDSLYASDIKWISGMPKQLMDGHSFECEYQVGHLRSPARCRIQRTSNASFEEHVTHVQFLDCPHWGIAPHQVIAFYQGQLCLGGGIIANAGPSYWHTQKPVPRQWTV